MFDTESFKRFFSKNQNSLLSLKLLYVILILLHEGVSFSLFSSVVRSIVYVYEDFYSIQGKVTYITFIVPSSKAESLSNSRVKQ